METGKGLCVVDSPPPAQSLGRGKEKTVSVRSLPVTVQCSAVASDSSLWRNFGRPTVRSSPGWLVTGRLFVAGRSNSQFTVPPGRKNQNFYSRLLAFYICAPSSGSQVGGKAWTVEFQAAGGRSMAARYASRCVRSSTATPGLSASLGGRPRRMPSCRGRPPPAARPARLPSPVPRAAK